MVWEIGLPFPLVGSISENPTDEELAEACKRGNVRAYERLYQMHAPRMKSLAFHMVGSRSDAEDVVQETFLKVYRAVVGFEGQSSLTTWIYRILINCCYDALRKRQRLAETQTERIERGRETKLPLRLALEKALGQINERQRLVFLMFEVEGLRHSEIAGILEVPEGTCRSWLFEAKRELKRLLTEAYREV